VDFHDTIEQSASIARSALQSMASHGIPANPKNFMLWYCYAGGSRPDIVQAIYEMTAAKTEFSDATNESLFQKFFGDLDRQEATTKATEGLRTMLDSLVELLGEAGTGARDYGETLKGANAKLTAGGADIKNVLASLMAETQKVAQQNEQLQGDLIRSSQEADALRETLASVEKENLTDGLTGINNRKVFDKRLKELAAQMAEEDDNLCLVMLDVDFFKKFNDSYGHQLGDQVLKLVAKTMESAVRPLDVPARYGGEEFSVIMPMAKLEDAARVANEIRMLVSSKKIIKRSTGEDLGQVTLSAGVAQHVEGEPLTKLIQRADAALYHAKRTGRNRVATEAELGPNPDVAPVKARV